MTFASCAGEKMSLNFDDKINHLHIDKEASK